MFFAVPKNKCAYIHQYKVVNGMQMKLHPAQQYQKMYPVGLQFVCPAVIIVLFFMGFFHTVVP